MKQMKNSKIKTGMKTSYNVDPFFITYSKGIEPLCKMPIFNVAVRVLWKLMELAEFNKGRIYMYPNRAEEIMSSCSISRASYQRAIRDLLDVGVIVKEKDCYIVVGNMFWKGSIKARSQYLKARRKERKGKEEE